MPTQEDAKKIVARNMKVLFAETGWTGVELQRRSGVAQTTISHITRTGSTTTGRLDAIAGAVKLPGWALMVSPFPGIEAMRGLVEMAGLYLQCDEEGREQIKRIAQTEARHSQLKR